MTFVLPAKMPFIQSLDTVGLRRVDLPKTTVVIYFLGYVRCMLAFILASGTLTSVSLLTGTLTSHHDVTLIFEGGALFKCHIAFN